MKKKIISTPKAPAAIGPYSQAIKIGNFLYTSGQISLDAEKMEMCKKIPVGAVIGWSTTDKKSYNNNILKFETNY